MSNISNSLKDKSLDELALQIRESVKAVQRASANALAAGLDAGDALIEALDRISTNKQKWLRDNCFLGLSTAKLYIQLANHRPEIEAELQRAGELSIRAARRLIASESNRPPKTPAPDLIAAMRRAGDTELTAMLFALGLKRFLGVMPPAWRTQLEQRIGGKLREGGETFLRASEVLRRALSLVKTAASAPGITPIVAASNEREAIAALRQLNTMLANADIDEVTIVKRYAKERRRAA